MSVFQLPKQSCKALSSAMAKFWWNSSENKNKIHWKSWEKMCLPKALGGLGFKDIESFNQALLAKQGWNILQNKDSLLARILESSYHSGRSFLQASIGSKPSYGWKSIIYGRKLLQKGIRIAIGDGEQTMVWLDPWLPTDPPRAPFRKQPICDWDFKIANLLKTGRPEWDIDKLREIFFLPDIELIKSLKPAIRCQDSWIWSHTINGNFSTKSGYELAFKSNNKELFQMASARPSTNLIKEQIWNLPTSPKIRNFLWKVTSEALPVADALERRKLPIDNICGLCSLPGETINHLLFKCTVARQTWAMSGIPIPRNGYDSGSIHSNVHYLMTMSHHKDLDTETKNSFPWILWMLWKNRNNVFFNGRRVNAEEIILKSKDEARQWAEANSIIISNDLDRASKRVPKEIKWHPPPELTLKCNIGIALSIKNCIGGAAWVLRNELGTVILHSRRAFAQIKTSKDMQYISLLWTLESLIAHKCVSVIIVSGDAGLVKVTNRPNEWLSYRASSSEVRALLKKIPRASLIFEPKCTNKGASIIAQSVAHQNRLQSYVAAGSPHWLHTLFQQESIHASLRG